MTLPNKLTFLRLVLIPVGVLLLFSETVPFHLLVALLVFLVAMLTDALDGSIARRYGLITALGTFLDPLADKLIILLYFLFLTHAGMYPLWLLVVVMARELLTDGFRSFAISKNVYIGAIQLGKFKAFLQTLSIVLSLLALAALQGEFPWWHFPVDGVRVLSFWSMVAAFTISLIGLYTLVRRNLSLLLSDS